MTVKRTVLGASSRAAPPFRLRIPVERRPINRPPHPKRQLAARIAETFSAIALATKLVKLAPRSAAIFSTSVLIEAGSTS